MPRKKKITTSTGTSGEPSTGAHAPNCPAIGTQGACNCPAQNKVTAPRPTETSTTSATGATTTRKVTKLYFFTPELGHKIVKLIEAGNYVETAAAVAGISKDTFYRWLKKGARQARKGKRTELAAWATEMQHAAARSEAADVLRVGAAAKRHWQAAAWRLERKFPERWGRRRVELTGVGGGPIETKTRIDLTKATDEELRILAGISERARDPSSKP